MSEAEELFTRGDAAEDAGDLDFALRCFKRGAALGDAACLERLGHMHDVGNGVEVDKQFAMRCYQKAWRRGGLCAANNIAILYREQGDAKAMAAWFKRAIERGDEDARVELAKCYLNGDGVGRSVSTASLHLRLAIKAHYITQSGQEEAATLLRTIEAGSSPADIGPLTNHSRPK
jgi:TPR repeat protein